MHRSIKKYYKEADLLYYRNIINKFQYQINIFDTFCYQMLLLTFPLHLFVKMFTDVFE